MRTCTATEIQTLALTELIQGGIEIRGDPRQRACAQRFAAGLLQDLESSTRARLDRQSVAVQVRIVVAQF